MIRKSFARRERLCLNRKSGEKSKDFTITDYEEMIEENFAQINRNLNTKKYIYLSSERINELKGIVSDVQFNTKDGVCLSNLSPSLK